MKDTQKTPEEIDQQTANTANFVTGAILIGTVVAVIFCIIMSLIS
jgi:hypothetical protein